MRILRFSNNSEPQYGILESDNLISILSGDPLYSGIQKTGKQIKLEDVKVLAPVLPRSKIVNVGKNFRDHAEEMGGGVPVEPLIFLIREPLRNMNVVTFPAFVQFQAASLFKKLKWLRLLEVHALFLWTLAVVVFAQICQLLG